MLRLDRILFSNFKSSGNRGFTIISMVLTVGLVLPILILSFISYFANQNKQNMAQKIKIDYSNLQTVIQMISSTPSECRFNIRPNFFGITLAQLNNLSAAGNIRLAAPPTGAVLLSKTVDYSGVIARRIFFSAPTLVQAGSFDYVADLNIEVSDRNSIAISRMIKIPFYISTNNAGLITECFATAYPDDTAAAPIPTMEDFLCKEIDSSYTKFIPSERACI